MEAIERAINALVHSVEKVLYPKIDEMSDCVKELGTEMRAMNVSHELEKGKVARLEKSVEKLKCEENTEIMRGLGARLAKVESAQEQGHKQDEECQKKNRQVEEALRLSKENQKTNEAQEKRYDENLKEQKERHQKIMNRIWMLFIALAGAAATAYFSGVFKGAS